MQRRKIVSSVLFVGLICLAGCQSLWDLQTATNNRAYHQVLHNVVSIQGDYYSRSGVRNEIVGTGFFINNEYVLTNKHITEHLIDDTVQIVLWDGTTIRAKLIAEDDMNDLALLRIDPKEVNDYKIRDVKFNPNVPLIGEILIMVGSPFGLNNTLTVGRFARRVNLPTVNSNLSRFWSCDIYLTDILSGSGSSGSPMVNSRFEVVSINAGFVGGYKVSIPAYLAVDFLKDNGILQ